ncbi:unnamed protein product [Phaeothamnion confervicola]
MGSGCAGVRVCGLCVSIYFFHLQPLFFPSSAPPAARLCLARSLGASCRRCRVASCFCRFFRHPYHCRCCHCRRCRCRRRLLFAGRQLRFSWKGKEVRNMHELHKEVLEYDSELSSLMERVSAIKDVSLSSLAMLKSVSRRDVQEMLQLSNIHACGMMLVLEELQRIGAPEPMPANPGMYKGPGPFGEHDVFDLDLARRGEGPSHGFRGPGGPGMPGMGPGMPGGPVSGSKPRSRAAGELDDGPYPGPRGPGKKGRFDHMGGGGKGGGGQGGGIEDEAWAQQYLEQLQPYKRVFCGKITKLTVDHLHRRSQKWKEALHFLESKSPAGYVQAMAVDRLLGVSKSARADWVHWDAVLENQNYPFDDPQAAAVYVSELKKEVVRIKGKAYSLKKGMLAEQQEERANAAAAAAAMANVGQFGGPSHP